MTEMIQPEKMVTLKYTMTSSLLNGTVKDHPQEEMTFVFGVERQVPSLEQALQGCRKGDAKKITIPAKEIYGEYDPGLVREIPKKGLVKQRLIEGQFYRQMKMGTLVSFKVKEVRPQTVLVDFNEPLAGIAVSMNFEVLAVRKASKAEIEEATERQMKKNIGCGD
jgi:FKBP-type peptidyl-prolyl cis-trans isomerase SlyD